MIITKNEDMKSHLKMLLIAFFFFWIFSLNECKLKIHVIPHTHDDAGWLQTVDEYYSGEDKCIKCILDTIYQGLKDNPQRTFVYSEIVFFERWYKEQQESVKDEMKKFVKEGRLEFVNGGWVMNDEACSLVQDIIDQFRLGLDFLYREFKIIPKVGWQLDPFGHSKIQANLLAKLGYSYLVMTRIDYKEKKVRKEKKEMEFIWKFNSSPSQEIFTHITFDHYSPSGTVWNEFFTFLLPKSETYFSTIAYYIYQYFTKIATGYKTNNILFLYGDDFTFRDSKPFENMDYLISFFNTNEKYKDKIELSYSTPSKYFKNILDMKIAWPKLDNNSDFFPYANQAHSYWTGYFTSRPYLKGFIRDIRNYITHSSLFYLNNVLRDSSLERYKTFLSHLNEMRIALSVAQHHDAVSGTAREHVSEDYIRQMSSSLSNVKKSYGLLVENEELKDDTTTVCIPSIAEFDCYGKFYDVRGLKAIHLIVITPSYFRTWPLKLLINTNKISILKNGVELSRKDYDLYCFDKENTKCQLTILYKSTSLYNIIQIQLSTDANPLLGGKKISLLPHEEVLIHESSKIKIQFNMRKGLRYIIHNNGGTDSYSTQVKYGYYKTNAINRYNSGAYIMEPVNEDPILYPLNEANCYYIPGNLLTVIHLEYSMMSQDLNIYKTEEFNYMVEVITDMNKLDLRQNTEHLFILSSDLSNKNREHDDKLEFYTDVNGGELTQRIKDFRLNWQYKKDGIVADNVYPVNSAISIKDNQSNRVITIWNDRPEGGISDKKGNIYLIINRVSTHDDFKGLSRGISEQRATRKNYQFTHWITFGKDLDLKAVKGMFSNKPLIIETKNSDILSNVKVNAQANVNLDTFFITSEAMTQNCFKVDYYILPEGNKFLMQVSNEYSDPYFTYHKCSFILNSEILKNHFNFQEMMLHGILPVEKAKNHFLKGSLSYSLSPFEFKTFLVEIIK